MAALEIDTALRKVVGWAGAYHGESIIAYPRTPADLTAILEYAVAKNYKVSTVGSSNSMGDSVVNSRNILLSTRYLTEVSDWDPTQGIVTVQAGVTIGQLLCQFIPLGWIPRSIPGVLTATMGGAISHNIHGKDSLIQGNFGRHVRWVDLLRADGRMMRLSRTENEELFRATVGGFGLTGVIVRASIQLGQIPSATLNCTNLISTSLQGTVDNLAQASGCDYAQVWLDTSKRWWGCGRGITMLSKFEETKQPPDYSNLEQYLTPNERLFGVIPSKLFWRSIRRFFYPPFISQVNAVYWYKSALQSLLQPRKSIPFHEYYFFHNVIGDFYSVYRPPGFIEIQALLPQEAGNRGFGKLIKKMHEIGTVSVLSGMKKTIQDEFMISFAADALTLSFDFPIKNYGNEKLAELLAPLYGLIADLGGKVNLSKDQVMPRSVFHRSYDQAGKFWEIKQRVDPGLLFSNDMSKRLFG